MDRESRKKFETMRTLNDFGSGTKFRAPRGGASGGGGHKRFRYNDDGRYD